MKRIIGLILLTLVAMGMQDADFCDGWEDGYCEGYRSINGQQSVCPVTPVCPVAEADGDTYSRGFARGYERGKEDAQ